MCLFALRSIPHLSSIRLCISGKYISPSTGFQAGVAVEALLEDWKEVEARVFLPPFLCLW